MKTPIDYLQAVQKLIEKPDNWLQNDVVQNDSGEESGFGRVDASKFCLFGACAHLRERGVADHIYRHADTALDIAADQRTGIANFIEFNDAPGRKHAEVLSLIDDAIEISRQKDW